MNLANLAGLALTQSIVDQLAKERGAKATTVRTIAYLGRDGVVFHGLDADKDPDTEIQRLLNSGEMTGWVDFGVGSVPVDGSRTSALMVGIRPSKDADTIPMMLPFSTGPFRLLEPRMLPPGEMLRDVFDGAQSHPHAELALPHLKALIDFLTGEAEEEEGEKEVLAIIPGFALTEDMLLRLKPDGSPMMGAALENLSIERKTVSKRGFLGFGKAREKHTLVIMASGHEHSWNVPPVVSTEDLDRFIEAVREAAAGEPELELPNAGEAWVLFQGETPEQLKLTSDAAVEGHATAAVQALQKALLPNPRARADVFATGFFRQKATWYKTPYSGSDEDHARLADQSALLLTSDGTLRDVVGRVILSAEEPPHPSAIHPFEPGTIRRRRLTASQHSAEGYPVVGLPPYERELHLRQATDVLSRALAASTASTLATAPRFGQPVPDVNNPEAIPEPLRPYLEHLTAGEREHLTSQSEKGLSELQWLAESAHAMLWAVGLVDELLPTNEMSDGADTVAAMGHLREHGTEGLALRSDEELLTALDDLHCRHWHTIDTMTKRRSFVGLPHNPGIVQQRLRALCWATGYLQGGAGTAWDEVELST